MTAGSKLLCHDNSILIIGPNIKIIIAVETLGCFNASSQLARLLVDLGKHLETNYVAF